MNEQDLISLLKINDTKAQFEFYNKYNKRLKGFLRKNCDRLDEEQIQEIVHDAFLMIFNKINLFSNQSLFSTWILKITYRCFLNWYKKNYKWMQNGIMVNKSRTILFSTSTDNEQEAYLLYEVEQHNFTTLSNTTININNIQKHLTTILYNGFVHKELQKKLKIRTETIYKNYNSAKRKIEQLI